jgi:hypothetical protein
MINISISLALAVVAFVRMQLFADGGGVDVARQQCAARAAIAVFVRKLQRCNCRHLAALHALLKGALRTRPNRITALVNSTANVEPELPDAELRSGAGPRRCSASQCNCR